MRRTSEWAVRVTALLILPLCAWGAPAKAGGSGICDHERKRVDSRFIAELGMGYGHLGPTTERVARVGPRLGVFHTDLVVVNGEVRVLVDEQIRELAAERSVYCLPKNGDLQRVDGDGFCRGDSVLVVTEDGMVAVNVESGLVQRLVRLEFEWERVSGALGIPVPKHEFGARPQLSEITYPALCDPELEVSEPVPELVYRLLGIIPVSRDTGSLRVNPTSGSGTLIQVGNSVTLRSESGEVQVDEIGEIRVIAKKSTRRPELVLIRVIPGVVLLDLEELGFLSMTSEWMSVE